MTRILFRRPEFIVVHLLLPMGLITMLTWLVYCIPVADVGDRLGCGLTLLLTSVAFKFIVADKLPDLSYTTFCDEFMLVTMLLQMAVCIHCGLVVRLFDMGEMVHVQYSDNLFAAVSFAVFLAAVLLFCVRGYRAASNIY